MKTKLSTLILSFLILSITATSGDAQRSKPRVQKVNIELAGSGYRPSSFRLKRNILARITFVRKTDDECGREVVFPAFGIRRDLPLNTPVTIQFTPKKPGNFSFACGMDMYHGKLIVQ